LAQSHPALAVIMRSKQGGQDWATWRVKDTNKGPVVWHAKHALIYIPDERRLPDGPYHLLVCTHALTDEVKYFLSNAPVERRVGALLRGGFSRWRIERCFEDGKSELGLWEGRRWLGLKRHLILITVSYLFLAETDKRLRKKQSGVDRVPGAARDRRAGSWAAA